MGVKTTNHTFLFLNLSYKNHYLDILKFQSTVNAFLFALQPAFVFHAACKIQNVAKRLKMLVIAKKTRRGMTSALEQFGNKVIS